ncbi:MAG: CpsD/CapB family tyrosine-protein kinase [Bacilli bacterium]|nr:CpsD/CapB family tyrosine-protein kinase [Bacilli bacterium]
MLFGKKKSSQRQNPIVVFKPGNEVITESFNRLKDNIVFQNVDNTIKVIQISSSTACEGKTTVISNLAVSLATNGNKVLLVDGDLRASRLHRPFNLANDIGLRDYVIGSKTFAEIIQKTSYNVDVICRGEKIENPSAVIASQKFQGLIEEAKGKYDYVLIDCPPVLEISDYLHISSISDGTIFCVAYGTTKKAFVKEAIALLKKSNVKLLGTVMTMVDAKQSRSYINGRYTNYYYNGK